MTASIFTGVHNFFHSSTWKDLSLGLIALVLLFWLATIYWVFKDARRRIEDPFLIALATIIGAVPPVLGPRLVATQSSNARALTARGLAASAEPFFTHVDAVPDPHAAVARARALAGPGGAVVVTGSLYLLSELSDSDDRS